MSRKDPSGQKINSLFRKVYWTEMWIVWCVVRTAPSQPASCLPREPQWPPGATVYQPPPALRPVRPLYLPCPVLHPWSSRMVGTYSICSSLRYWVLKGLKLNLGATFLIPLSKLVGWLLGSSTLELEGSIWLENWNIWNQDLYQNDGKRKLWMIWSSSPFL